MKSYDDEPSPRHAAARAYLSPNVDVGVSRLDIIMMFLFFIHRIRIEIKFNIAIMNPLDLKLCGLMSESVSYLNKCFESVVENSRTNAHIMDPNIGPKHWIPI